MGNAEYMGSPTQTTAPFVRVASVLELTCGSNQIVAVSRISRNMKPSMQCQCRAWNCLYLRFSTLMASKNNIKTLNRDGFKHLPFLLWLCGAHSYTPAGVLHSDSSPTDTFSPKISELYHFVISREETSTKISVVQINDAVRKVKGRTERRPTILPNRLPVNLPQTTCRCLSSTEKVVVQNHRSNK